MSFLSETPSVSGSTALDLLNILDILKNEELYRDRLKTIQDEIKLLNESKWANATVEQAQLLMDGVKEAEEKFEQYKNEQIEQLRQDKLTQQEKYEANLRALRIDRERIKKDQDTLQNVQSKLREEQKELEKIKNEVIELRRNLSLEIETYHSRREDYTKRIVAIQDIINK